MGAKNHAVLMPDGMLDPGIPSTAFMLARKQLIRILL